MDKVTTNILYWMLLVVCFIFAFQNGYNGHYLTKWNLAFGGLVVFRKQFYEFICDDETKKQNLDKENIMKTLVSLIISLVLFSSIANAQCLTAESWGKKAEFCFQIYKEAEIVDIRITCKSDEFPLDPELINIVQRNENYNQGNEYFLNGVCKSNDDVSCQWPYTSSTYTMLQGEVLYGRIDLEYTPAVDLSLYYKIGYGYNLIEVNKPKEDNETVVVEDPPVDNETNEEPVVVEDPPEEVEPVDNETEQVETPDVDNETDLVPNNPFDDNETDVDNGTESGGFDDTIEPDDFPLLRAFVKFVQSFGKRN